MARQPPPLTGSRSVVGSCPLDCPDACSWVVTVDDDGRAVRLRGNPDHPITQGGLCKKINPWLEYGRDPGRLLHPKRRVGPKGSGRFEPISWETAFEEMASRFHKTIDRWGGAAIWPFVGTGNLGFLQGSGGPDRVWSRMGASAHQVTICSVSGHAGIGYTSGAGGGLDPEDIADAGLVLLWGTNPLVTNQHFWPFLERARASGTKVVVIDPVRTRTADRADGHHPIRPGTDGALALGLCRAVRDRGGADEAYLGERSLGWDEFRSSLDRYTTSWAAQVTGLSVDAIETLADEIVAAPPLAVRLGQGMQRQASGGQAARVISCLPMLTGAVGRRGGGLLYSSSRTVRLNVERGRRPELGRRPRSLAMTNLGHNLTALDDPPIEALIVYGANPMVSNPELDLVRRGLGRDDLFTVVIDLYQTETADYADLVLPSTMQHEQTELNDSYFHNYLNWNEPAVAPPGECLPHTEIFRRLARAMGYTEPELFADDHELAADYLDQDDFRAEGITVTSLRERGFARMPGTTPFLPFAERFSTPSGLFEFTSERAAEDDHGLLPHYEPPIESAEPEPGAVALIAAASDHHINSVFAGTERTRSRTSAPPVAMHPEDAAEAGVAEGDRVLVGNDRGSFEADLILTDRVRRGLAITTKGWWRQGLNATVAERDSDMGRGAIFHDNQVTVKPI